MGDGARDAVSAVLITSAQIWRQGHADVRIAEGRIAEIGTLEPRENEVVLDAKGGALLPGLHDHHIHLASLAVKRASVACGPPGVTDEADFAQALDRPGDGWLRGIGYHESVAGMLTAAMLDQVVADRPVRIQHRSGRMWFLNSRAMDLLLAQAAPPQGLDRATGQLFDEDRWLRDALGSSPPSFESISAELASMGVTGLTDMSPANDPAMAAHFAREQSAGSLRQTCLMAGTLSLAGGAFSNALHLGPAKLHLHEADLPDLDDTIGFMAAAHTQGRGVAIHCTTETELVFALASLEAAGPRHGDRIEHVGVAYGVHLAAMARMGLWAVSQPHFIAERGDQYLRDVEPRDQQVLYRLASLQRAGIILAAGSDAPFASHDPWAAMRAAVLRRTTHGAIIGAAEALSPEEALALFFADARNLAHQRTIKLGAPADLCLLDRPWEAARTRLDASDVRATLIGGSVVHNRVDQAPIERDLRADPPA
jgi:predicted amidohydrolase YtcJ